MTEKKAAPPLLPQPESKRFVPPSFEEIKGGSAKTPSLETINKTADEPFKKQEQAQTSAQISAPVKKDKNSFRQKILEAQKAQAESQQREFNPQPQEKIIPVDAVNIIHAPYKDFREDFGQEQVDYSDEEERLAASAHADGIDISLAHHLFDESAIPEEEQEPFDWQAFLAYCEEHDFPVEYIPLMQGLKVVLAKENCYVKVSSGPQATIFNKLKSQLENLLCTFLGRTVKIQVTIVAYELISDEKLREKASNNSQIQMLMKEFGAEIYRCYDIKHDRKN